MSTSSLKLNDEQIDDLLYCARAGEVEDLAAYLDELVPKASADGDVDVVKRGKQAVLEQVQDASGNGMFHYVGANGHLATFTLLSPLTTLSLLLHQNSSGNTPLHWAGLNGHLPLVKAIVERVEQLEKVDVEGAREIRVKQREEERRRRAETRRKRRGEEEAGKKEGDGEVGKATNGDDDKADGDGDDEEPPELSLWDLRNNFGRGPTSESQMNEREEVVQWLLARMAAGGGSSAAAAAEKKDEAGAGDKETEELERRTEAVGLEEKEKA